ncbi:MAG: hypothetical protein MUE40_03055 [Anaerolineae bacterium]|nr:hypothetical protein [Anaerolineae bacterium]
MGIIIVLSFAIVVAVMFYGTRGEEAHAEESAAVAYWSARAEKLQARQHNAVAAATLEAAPGAAEAEAEKERKRQEALARKAARAAKGSGDS